MLPKQRIWTEQAEGIVRAAFSYSGQKCSACSRIYVQRSIKSKFISKLVRRTKELTVGNPLNPETFVGPLINSNSFKNFSRYSRLATKDGKVLVGGSLKKDNNLKFGFYAEPTIVDSLPKDHVLFKKELFVPILCLSEYDKFDQALAMCNESDYGLTAGIYTKRKEEVKEFLNCIEAGVVYVNRAKQCHNWGNGGMSIIWRLEGFRYNWEGNWRQVLLDTIYARAESNYCRKIETRILIG